MEIAQSFPLLPGDPRLIDHIVCELKSQGIFDQFRKECIADVDTKPAYQNLRQRVEGSVAGFLSSQKWKPDLNKNQLREKLRKHILDSNFLDQGVERIVDQAINPKIASVFLPQVEEVVYKCFGLEKPERSERDLSNGITESTSELKISTDDLLPCDLEAVSPDSVKSQGISAEPSFANIELPPEQELEIKMVGKKEETDVKVERTFPTIDSDDSDDSKDEEFESPAFEPIEDDSVKQVESPNNSQMSELSDMNSRDSNDSSSNANELTNLKATSTVRKSNEKALEAQLSQVSTDSDISIKVPKTGKKSLMYDSTFSGDDANISSPVRLNSSDANTSASFKFTNDDNSSDARQCFEQSIRPKEVSMECDDNSMGSAKNQQREGAIKSSSGSETTELINRHRTSVESKSSESNKATANMDVSMDSNESKASSIFIKNERYEVKDSYTFTNKITSMDGGSIDDDDWSSNGLKIDIPDTSVQYSEQNIDSIKRLSISGSDNISVSMKSPSEDTKAKESRSNKSDKHKDSHSERRTSRSKDERRSASSHHSKDHRDKRGASKHHSKSSHSKHRDSSKHDERKHSSSRDRKDSYSKSSKESADKDKYGRSSNGDRKDSSDKHKSSSSRHSSSSKHYSSSKHHESSHKSRHSTSDKSERHSLSRHDSKDSHKSDRHKDSSKNSEGGSSSTHRDKPHSSRHGERGAEHPDSPDRGKSQTHGSQRDKSNSKYSDKGRKSSTSGDKKDDKKGKEKSEVDDHYSSSGRSARTRRSTDRDSNDDGNNGSMKSSSSNSLEYSTSANQSTNKEKSSSSGKDNCSNGNVSSGQSDSAVKDKLNISAGGYIKSEFNMFQPVVKKPPVPLMNLHRSPDAIIKKPVIYIDSQLNPIQVEEDKVEEPSSEDVHKLKKPKFASNIFEARKLMKVRKNMNKMELKRKQDAQELIEKQNNVSKNESRIFSGISGPELEITCPKNNADTLRKCLKMKKMKDDTDFEPELMYFDEDSKRQSLIDLEKVKKHLAHFLTTVNGIEHRLESVIHLIGCDKSLEQAFVKLSRKNHLIKTVNIPKNGLVNHAASKQIIEKRNKTNLHKLEIPVDSEIIFPSSSQCYVDLSESKPGIPNELLKYKRLPLKKRKLTGRKVARNIEIKPDIVVEIKPDVVQEKIMPNYEVRVENVVHDLCDEGSRNMETSGEYGDDYYSRMDDMLSRATTQEIMEIILGGEVHFDASRVDLKFIKNEYIDQSLNLNEIVEVDTTKVETSNGRVTTTRKRKISFKLDEDILDRSRINNNNNLKEKNEPTVAKRRNIEKVSSTEDHHPGDALAPTNNNRRVEVKRVVDVIGPLGKARRVGLSKTKKLTGISRNKMSQNIPRSPESDKSVENHISHDLFTVKPSKNFKENSDDVGSTALNQVNHQITKRTRTSFKDKITNKNCINEKLFEPNRMSMEQAQ